VESPLLKQSTLVKEDKKHNEELCGVPGCDLCQLKKPFELPQEIVSACEEGDLVIFAGAGISTERNGACVNTFYQWIQKKLPQADKKISFAKLMTQYSSEPRSRKDLLQAIKTRIDFVNTFPEIYRNATEFHRELSTIPHLYEIFTTNWDDFFERECGATPIVTSPDYAILNDISGRKVFKLHGSIYNYGSIIATEDDYRKCYRKLNTGIIGAKLKTLIMSKTVVFFGFSFDDDDFQKLYRLLRKEVEGFMPRLYVVTLDETAKNKLDLLKIRAIPIITDAVFFVKQLKKMLVEKKWMVSDDRYKAVRTMLSKVRNEHTMLMSAMKVKNHPDACYSLFYQDGLIHSFERLLAIMRTGENSCGQHVKEYIEENEDLIKHCLRKREFVDVAYLRGYQAGLIYFLLENDSSDMPLYLLFGCKDIKTFKEFAELEKDAKKFHESAHAMAEEIARSVESDKLIVHKSPSFDLD
jgi:NAD-dependent SIR2 family protein deacetylase